MITDDFIPHLERFTSYEEASQRFRWNIPDSFNIVDAVCRRHPDAVTRIALIEVRPAADNVYTFNAINFLADRFAAVLASTGIRKGDRVAVILAQSAAVPVAHLGALKVGALVVPLSPALDPALLVHRIKDSGAHAVVVDVAVRGKLEGIIAAPADGGTVFVATDFVVGEDVQPPDRNFWAEVYRASSDFEAVETDAGTAAFLFYDRAPASEGVIYGHGALAGHLPAFEMSNNVALSKDDVFWTPGDWATASSLCGLLYSSWVYGLPVVACESETLKSARAIEMMKRCAVTTALLAPDEISALLEADTSAGDELDLKLRNIICGGAMVSSEIRKQVRAKFNAAVFQRHGWPEVACVAAHCDRWFPPRPGSLGRAAVGHRIEIIDENGNVVPLGTTGRLALRRPDPALSLGALRNRERTAASAIGEWFFTGELGHKDEDGYLWIARP